jgi:hypothetical protein
MKTKEEILKNIEENKDLQKYFKKLYQFTNEEFYDNAMRYIKAVRENRIICSIGSVSKSGMSRNLKFMECNISPEGRTNWYNFNAFFIATGHKKSVRDGYFTISGAGMDMIFYTNYLIINKLGKLGFLDKEEVSSLAQNTPPVI